MFISNGSCTTPKFCLASAKLHLSIGLLFAQDEPDVALKYSAKAIYIGILPVYLPILRLFVSKCKIKELFHGDVKL